MRLGRKVTFEAGEGPSLAPVASAEGLDRRSEALGAEASRRSMKRCGMMRGRLAAETALLGFAGAPWTLATYLAAGAGGDEQKAAKLWAYRDPEGFETLLDILAECVAFHLIRQLEAGADAVQIFDSWAGGIPEQLFARWVIQPTKKIVERSARARPGAKIIGFPRAATLAGYEAYARETGVDALSLDTSAPMAWAAKTWASGCGAGQSRSHRVDRGRRRAGQAVDEILAAMEGQAASSSISVMACCRKRRSTMLSNWWRGCRAAREAGRRPVQSGRAGFAGGRGAVPAKSFFRSGDHRLPAIVRLPLARFIATRRAPVARENLAKWAGARRFWRKPSAQADALEQALSARGIEASASSPCAIGIPSAMRRRAR